MAASCCSSNLANFAVFLLFPDLQRKIQYYIQSNTCLTLFVCVGGTGLQERGRGVGHATQQVKIEKVSGSVLIRLHELSSSEIQNKCFKAKQQITFTGFVWEVYVLFFIVLLIVSGLRMLRLVST